jgi:hypothetical protein
MTIFPIIHHLVTPAQEDVIQLAREKTVANFCSTAAVIGALAQPLVCRPQAYPGDLSAKFGKSFDLLQPFLGKANWLGKKRWRISVRLRQ